MKEFENWWKENGDVTCSPAMHFDKKDAKRVWKAALRWAIEEETWQGTDEGGSWGISRENIEEELNAETD